MKQQTHGVSFAILLPTIFVRRFALLLSILVINLGKSAQSEPEFNIEVEEQNSEWQIF
jgi:hypothetical protein